jgi:putative toxin-antitoxin system antitoxin component (TIGR02293 family)
MRGLRERAVSDTGAGELQRVIDLLGGSRVLRRTPRSRLDAHEMLLRGLPGGALTHLVNSLTVIERSASLEKAVGMSLRTYQRRRDAPTKPLTPDQSGRAWKFAEILAKATALLGSQEEAERWLERPATGLDQQRPIDLLATPAGIAIIEDFLLRLEHGVYM